MSKLYQWPVIEEMVASIKDGSASAVDNVQTALNLIAEHDSAYKAILNTCEQRALSRAKEIDAAAKAQKPLGRLAGVPFIAKDNMLTFGAETTAASKILKGYVAPYQATIIERLEAEGAVCVAKANMDAFAHGGSTLNSDYQITKNPHDVDRVPGGSSGGSAASVALGYTPFATGSDTGGSIRQPASYCGIVGLRPTYGLVSRSGVIAMVSSMDTMGVLTRNVAETAMILDCIAGIDGKDSTSIAADEKGYGIDDTSVKGKKVAVIREHMGDSVDDAVKDAVRAAIEKLRSAGAIVEEVSLPTLDSAIATYYILVPAEISSNLSRYDGQRYQYSNPNSKDLQESYARTRSDGFGDEAKRRIMIGTYVLSSGYYDAYYGKAQLVRTKIAQELSEAFKDYDFLVGPTAPSPAFKIDEITDPLQMYLQDLMTTGSSLAGIPAISIPCGHTNGLPIGLQIMAPRKQDRELLRFAHATEGVLEL